LSFVFVFAIKAEGSVLVQNRSILEAPILNPKTHHPIFAAQIILQ
jgi:hypothetical protein